MGWIAKLFYVLLAATSVSMPVIAAPMTFFADRSDEQKFYDVLAGRATDVYATGEITEGTTERFLQFVRINKIQIAQIHFNSPGGNLGEGIRLGRAIRDIGFMTAVGVYQKDYVENGNANAICTSACAYAFAGGVSRFLNQYSGRLGIHQFYGESDTTSGSAVQQVSGFIVAYLNEMGIDARAFSLSTVADRDGMIWLTEDTALALNFVNNGSEPPVAEIKLAGMHPYLRVQQEHYNVTTRVLFNCEARRVQMIWGIVTDSSQTGMIIALPQRSYFELDGEEFSVMANAAGLDGEDSVAWISRWLDPTALIKLVSATNVDGWVDGSGAVRWGAGLAMPTVRKPILEFAKQCYAS